MQTEQGSSQSGASARAAFCGSPSQSQSEIAAKLFMLLLLAAGTFTRAWRLGDKALSCDEGFIWHVASFDTIGKIIEHYKLEQHTPLPNIISHFWMRAFGDSAAALHAEPLAWSLIAMLIFAWAAWTCLPRRIAIGSVAALALSPFLPEFAQTLRYPALALLFSTVWIVSLLKLLNGGGRGWLVACCVGATLAVYAHLFNLLAVFCGACFILATLGRWGKNAFPLLLCHAAPAIAIIPKFLQMREMGVSDLASAVPFHEAMAHLSTIPVGGLIGVFFDFCAGRSLDMRALPIAATLAILATFGAVAAVALLHPRRRFEAALCASVFGGAVFIGWLAMIFRSVDYNSSYYVPLAPMFCLLLGIGADAARRRFSLAAPILFAMLALFSLFTLSTYWSRIDRLHNLKSAMEYIEDNAIPGDFVNVSPPYVYFLSYYWNNPAPAHRFAPDFKLWSAPQNNHYKLNADRLQLSEADIARWHFEVASRYDRVWMYWILGHVNTEDKQGVAFQWMEKNYRRVSEIQVRNFSHTGGFIGALTLYEIPSDIKHNR